jgi:hypothetical protein
MMPIETSKPTRTPWIVAMLATLVVGLSALSASAHGPKGHGEQTFTALEAAKKGITLYDKLVAGGKLEESWETGLTEIKVFSRSREDTQEFVVQFERIQGEPRSVYIFFDEKGAYSGSNFTGE